MSFIKKFFQYGIIVIILHHFTSLLTASTDRIFHIAGHTENKSYLLPHPDQNMRPDVIRVHHQKSLQSGWPCSVGFWVTGFGVDRNIGASVVSCPWT